MEELANKQCVDGAPGLSASEVAALCQRLGDGWQAAEKRLRKAFRFDNFLSALDFTNRVGALAEELNHHPEIHLSWGQAIVEIWTHTAGGITENDFILAARIERGESD